MILQYQVAVLLAVSLILLIEVDARIRVGEGRLLDILYHGFSDVVEQDEYWNADTTYDSTATYVALPEGQVKIYRPKLFTKLRHQCSIRNRDFLDSICFDNLTCISADSKSGQGFWVSGDEKVVLKTIRGDECRALRRMLDAYQNHCGADIPSCIASVFGVFRVRTGPFPPFCSYKYFLASRNVYPQVFSGQSLVLKKYDLKGSSVGRFASRTSPVEKDCDLMADGVPLALGPQSRGLLLSVLDRDLAFLSQCNLMDYSVLVAVERNPTKHGFRFRPSGDAAYGSGRGVSVMSSVPDDAGKLVLLGADGNSYHFGIIDFLQRYTFRKVLETWFKSWLHKATQISCVAPKFYAQRLAAFMNEYTR